MKKDSVRVPKSKECYGINNASLPGSEHRAGVLKRGIIRVFDQSGAVIWTVDSNVSGDQ